ncbi:MAG: hypothetical protein RRB24_10875 [Armatimonadota bacterium]|nr:hypothetical protein [Armatimonadota bacterium]MDT7973318.1 hypothetical protein [Armatimonadota bacterium]
MPLQQIRRFGDRQIVWSRQIAAPTSQVVASCHSNKFGSSAIGKSANRLVAADCRSNIASRGKLPLQQIRQFGNRQVVWSRQIAALTSQVVADCRSNKFGGSAIGKSFGRGRLPP